MVLLLLGGWYIGMCAKQGRRSSSYRYRYECLARVGGGAEAVIGWQRYTCPIRSMKTEKMKKDYFRSDDYCFHSDVMLFGNLSLK